MNITEINAKRMPIVILIVAVAVIFVTIFNRYAQTTAAERAVRSKSYSRLTEIIARNPGLANKPNRKNGLTPLHWAVMNDQTNMVEFLLAHGANASAPDLYGMTPLHKAASFNRLALAKMLIAKGADPRTFGIKYGAIQVAPIHLAAEAGSADIVKLFLDLGIDINLRTEGKNRVTPLHMAAAKGRAGVVELLLKSGADVNARDVKNTTPMHWAITADQKETADMLKIYGGVE